MADETKYTQAEPHLEVFHDHSVLVYETGRREIFDEGKLSKTAQARLQKIKAGLEAGFLTNLIRECSSPDAELGELDARYLNLLESLVNAITSEVGRAIVGLTVLQLCIKCLAPDQSIRLHKGSNSYSSTRFSWRDGIPMRSLDKSFITPVLRSYGILRTNADGVMMTRSLAENYPYSKLYKAAIRGAREEWLEIIELLEAGMLDPEVTLRHLIVLLRNKSEQFRSLAETVLQSVRVVVQRKPSIEAITQFIRHYIDTSNYSARLLEIALHSLFQVLEDNLLLDGHLKPLAQMRSANKKHGNIGDVEVTIGAGTLEIREAWDAKYGKSYLRDELEELNEKLNNHLETEMVGFVVDQPPLLKQEIIDRMQELEALHDVEIKILSFEAWVALQLAQSDDQPTLALEWLLAFTETLCQLRRDRAPIDEPADTWVAQLQAHLQAWQ